VIPTADATGGPDETDEIGYGRRFVGECRSGAGVPVSGDRGVLIALTDAQVEQVLRDASGRPHPGSLLPEIGEVDVLSGAALALLGDESCSRSALRALLVLNALPPDGSWRELTAVARELGISPSTTHRYLHTWLALGLVARHPRSRLYRRMRVEDGGAQRAGRTGGADAG